MTAFATKIPLVSLAVDDVRRVVRGVPAIPATLLWTSGWFTSRGTAATRYGGCHYMRFLVSTTLDCWIDEWPATIGEVQCMVDGRTPVRRTARRTIRVRAQRLAVAPRVPCAGAAARSGRGFGRVSHVLLRADSRVRGKPLHYECPSCGWVWAEGFVVKGLPPCKRCGRPMRLMRSPVRRSSSRSRSTFRGNARAGGRSK